MTQRFQNLMVASMQTLLCLTIVLSAQSTVVSQLTAFDRESIKIRDSVRLRNGVRLRGEIIKEGKDESGRDYTIFKTESQSTLKLDTRFVNDTHVVDADDKLYNNKVKIMDDTPEHHWDAVKWCEKQSAGAIRFKDQIDFHLNRIMLLDPNDTKVRHRLDYDYLEEQDRWVPRKLYWNSLGYQSHGKAWVPNIREVVNQSSSARNANLGDRKSRFSIWKRNVKVGRLSKTELENELFAICDAAAVQVIFEESKRESSPEIQALYIEAFGKVPTGGAAQALVYFSVQGVGANRDRALDLLLQDHYEPSFVAGHLARYFDPNKHSNKTLQRAAFNVGVVNDTNSVLPLVGVLSTKHVVAPADDPNRLTTTFSSNGNLDGFSTGGSGQAKTVVAKNREVLGALKKISKEDFGFDEEAWKKWYVENHTTTDVNVRGDFGG